MAILISRSGGTYLINTMLDGRRLFTKNNPLVCCMVLSHSGKQAEQETRPKFLMVSRAAAGGTIVLERTSTPAVHCARRAKFSLYEVGPSLAQMYYS